MITLMLAVLTSTAGAYVAEECVETANAGPPADYDEQAQADFLLNYFSLATTFSPIHAPVPHKPGTGSVGLEVAVIPPLGCERRLVLNYSKTEDTNKAPAAPRPRVSFTFPKIGPVALYAGLGYVPPVTVFGTRNVIVSGEAGFGVHTDSGLQLGGRYHATLMKTIAEIATPFEEGGEAYDDFYMGSTFGIDAMVGYKKSNWTPYAAIGFTDASTFFYIGDDAVVGNNLDPYASLVASAGTQWRPSSKIVVAGEFYTAPGYIYTARFHIGYVIGGGADGAGGGGDDAADES